MASSRELAQQAFALLQSALRESEERATALDAELKRKRPARNQIEEQLEVLTHRLENVETECTHWRREAASLEEVVDNERAKVAQLRKKLEIAESGPEKLTKKEINYWRGKANSFDKETGELKQRLAELRRELKDREQELERLGAVPPAPHPSVLQELEAELESLRAAIAERERALARTAAEHEQTLANFKAEQEQALALIVAERAERSTELERGLATLKQQLAAVETERAETESQIAALRRDIEQQRAAIEARDATIAALQRERGEHARIRDVLAERDARLSALGAELEKTRVALEKSGHEVAALNTRISTLDKEALEAKHRADELVAALDGARAALSERERAENEAESVRTNELARELELQRNHAHQQEEALQATRQELDRRSAKPTP